MGIIDDLRLDGKVALVTGASRGIGEAIALAYAEAGADLVLAARSTDLLEGVAGKIRALGRQAFVETADVADLDAIGPLAERAAGHRGRLDILVNVAGVTRRKSILEVTPEDYSYVMDINLRGTFFMSQAAARIMIPQGGGKIVNIASMTTFRGFVGTTVYGLSKAAVAILTKNMAIEWAPHNIQVNAIAPGWIDTPMTATMQPHRRQWVEAHVPQGRFGTSRELAGMAVYLASRAADYTTGQVMPVDGGFLAGSSWD